MASWALRRQLSYGLLVVVVIAAAGVFSYFQFFYAPPSCSDGKHNGAERGVDCGGDCIDICPADVTAPTVFWTRVIPFEQDRVDLVALAENTSQEIGNPSLVYTFKVYDAQNRLILEKPGKTFVNPREQFAVIETSVPVENATATRAFIEFSNEGWERFSLPENINIRFSYHNQLLRNLSEAPQLDAAVRNISSMSVEDIEVITLLYDQAQTLVGANVTYINDLSRNEQEPIFFSWREPFASTPVRIDLFARINQFFLPQ